jgi:hypothetical protein
LDVKRDNFVSALSVDETSADTEKIIDFDTSRVLEHSLQENLTVLLNKKTKPMWPDRWGIFHGPEFKKEKKVLVGNQKCKIFILKLNS